MSTLLALIGPKELLGQLVDLALRIQSISVESINGAAPSLVGLSAAHYSVARDVEHWLEFLQATSHARPALMLAGRWLADNAPVCSDVVLQHHDFRLGNVLIDAQGRAAAVLDWEFAGAGDPLCDIGYAAQPYCLGRLLRNESSLDLRPDPTSWVLHEYTQRAGGGSDPDRLRYFVALGIFKMAVALVLPADTWWRGEGGLRDRWLELPILSLTDDLIRAIREL
jgi:aminoglycoside phosphotransferase (APT) family kinase protein